MKSKLWHILVSAVIAFGLWLYVITIVSPGSEKTYYDIPVILQNENALSERGLMITGIEDSGVTMTLQGNRTDLNELNESNINLLANMSGIAAPGTHLVSYDTIFPGNIASNAITTLSKDPDMLVVKVENRLTKQVPVKIDYLGAVPEGFIADKENVVLDYPAIEVSGPQSVVSQIDNARIQVVLENQVESVIDQYVYTLCNESGNAVDAVLVTTNVETVQLNLKIQRYKDIDLIVKTINGGGATDKNSSIKITPEKIRIAGSEALLERLDSLELGTINLGEILQDETITFPIVLPEGITNITGTAEATVEVKFPTLKIRTMHVTNIQVVNQPADMELELMTQSLEVRVRGPMALVDRLKDSDVTVIVDCTGAQPGTATMNAVISIQSVFKDVGAVGTYSVTANLQPTKERNA